MMPSRVLSRYTGGLVRAYDLSAAPRTVSAIMPAAIFPIGSSDLRLDSHAVAADLTRAVYAVPNHVTCIDRDGRRLWQLDFARAVAPLNAHNCCTYSLDGTILWVYRPDGMVRRAGTDQWLAVDADTGKVLAQEDLKSVGQGAEHFVHPDGRHILLSVGEGQDGSLIYQGRFSSDRIELTEYGWTDRALVALAPDGRHFMTVQHEQKDAAFHKYPDGAVTAHVTVDSLGHDPDESFIEWVGGYLRDDTAVVTVGGETEDEDEWYERYLVDPGTGEVRGQLESFSAGLYDFEPLGDGSWLTTDDERLQRHSR